MPPDEADHTADGAPSRSSDHGHSISGLQRKSLGDQASHYRRLLHTRSYYLFSARNLGATGRTTTWNKFKIPLSCWIQFWRVYLARKSLFSFNCKRLKLYQEEGRGNSSCPMNVLSWIWRLDSSLPPNQRHGIAIITRVLLRCKLLFAKCIFANGP